jgi:class 3 adenylate cyclase
LGELGTNAARVLAIQTEFTYRYAVSEESQRSTRTSALQTTAILKTDIKGSTPTFRSLQESDLSALLTSHHEFVTRIASAHGGRIVKPEGDGFWMTFPSVTAAALAAMAMQEELQLAQPNKGDDRIAMRIVITLGDVLNPEGALIGDAVVLAARIEALTPPDEIFLSAAARLAVNQGEVRTGLVDSFVLKGFSEPVPVYRIEQRHRTQVIKDQYIVITELRSFSAFSESAAVSSVEKTLDRMLDLVGQVCRDFNGTSRFNAGDSYWLTFLEAGQAVAAADRLAREWRGVSREMAGCLMNVVVHKGTLNAYRSYLYGSDLSLASAVEQVTHNVAPSDTSVFVTGIVHRDLARTPWPAKLKVADIKPHYRRLADLAFYRLDIGD